MGRTAGTTLRLAAVMALYLLRSLLAPTSTLRDQAVREAAEIVQAAYREVAGG